MVSGDGPDRFVIDCLMQVVPLGLVDGAGMSVAERAQHIKTAKFEDMRRSSWDPKCRAADQDRDGIAAEIIYASVGMTLCTHPDAEYKDACMRAYNRWLQGFCGECSASTS